MNAYKKLLIAVLALMLVLSGCRSSAGEMAGAAPTGETAASEAAETTQATEAETQPETAPAEKQEAADDAVIAWNLKETVLPDKNQASGALIFYVNGKSIYAGGKVADLIEAGIHTYDDLNATVKPHEMSELIRVRVDIPNESDEAKEPLLFFVAMNPGKEAVPVSECLIYSMTANCEKGVQFGSGNEKYPFTTYVTTRNDIEAAYGQPTEVNSQSNTYAEIVYYKPFNCVSFVFKDNVVRQIFSYYSANVFGDLAKNCPVELNGDYFGADCFILMNEYLDVTDYLPGHALELKAQEEQDLHAQRKAANLPKAGETGVFDTLPEEITLGSYPITLGCRCSELPDIWWNNLTGLMTPIQRHYYMRVGRNAKEEFYLINDKGQSDKGYLLDNCGVKGVITENCNYTNWGKDNSAFYPFTYDGLTQDASITDIVAKYGQPSRLFCSSNGRLCFAWMHYDAVDGNRVQFKVDPIANKIMEIRVSKYFADELHY